MVSIYSITGNTGTHIAVIKAALLEKYRVSIDFEETRGEDTYHYRYQFILVDSAQPLVWCVMCRGIRTDPLNILSTHKSLKEFGDYLGVLIEPINDVIIGPSFEKGNIKKIMIEDIKVYPYDWYACFESDENKKMNAIKKIIPKILERGKTIKVEDAEDRKVFEYENMKKGEQARLMTELMFLNMNPTPRSNGSTHSPVGVVLPTGRGTSIIPYNKK